MVKAILNGRKTVTRRVCKIPDNIHPYRAEPVSYELAEWDFIFGNYINGIIADMYYTCKSPYEVGEILYVRETWAYGYESYLGAPDWESIYIYKADGKPVDEIVWDKKWKPSIHMPKEAARIFLRVTDIRVERLQDITEEQAQKEGVPDSLDYPVDKIYCPRCNGDGLIGTWHPETLGFMDSDCPECNTAVKRFKNLWNSTIKKSELEHYSWAANPWVWVIEFERTSADQK